jgi:hypothetical protein
LNSPSMSALPSSSGVFSLLPGVNVLLEGPTGTGKNHAIGTLIEYGASAGFEVFLLAVESGYEATLGYFTDRAKAIPENFHWHHLQQAGNFDALLKKVDDIGRLTQDALYKIQDNTRAQKNYFATMLRALHDFPCDRTGKNYGSVGQWGTNRVLVVDGLTGLGVLAMSLVVGTKPVKSQAEWGIAQDVLEPFLRQLCDNCRCHFVLLSHVEREVDQISGATKVTVQSLGRALPPKIPPMFSDVILTVRNGREWSWSTAAPQADLKTRNLSVADGIRPDFADIFRKWESRGGRYER